MGLLNHDEPAKPKLTRGAKVVVNNQVSRNDVVKETANTSFPVNIRVDNHIRNQISSLINIGMANSQKDLVQKLVNESIDGLENNEKLRFDRMFNILEQKDSLKSNS
ncbi:DUF5388 domain-containing protein (plasmid) [Pediococcus siamensis]|uniref:DUF5388 domain-containing protein n=1 Tax=Pediococcus siamensis TaxID=381829 RepID=UPI00399FA6CA